MRRADVPADPEGDASAGPRSAPVEHDDGRLGPALRLLAWATAVVLSVVLVRLLLVQSFVIPSTSMEPTLEVGDRVIVLRLPGLTGSVERGDVVVFDGAGVFDDGPAPASSPLAAAGRAVARALGAPVGRSDYVKRVVGLPGERVTCCDPRGRLTVDGVPLDEPYLFDGDVPSELRFDVVVPPDRLWVMGDHRSESGDSRAHLGDPGGGTVPVDRVTGRVVAVWWPTGRAATVPRVTYPAAGS
jgi:signal peptidase I